MNDWDDLIPKWRKEGRTGPGPLAPRYAKAKDRRTVRNGGTVGKDQFGSGGSRKISKGSIKRSQQGGSHKPPKKGCCPMVAAVRSVKQGKFRLARRYAAMSVGLLATRVAGRALS